MKIAVMGAGAVGCYYGGLLARAGHEVVLIGRPAHVEAIRAGGLRLTTAAFDERVALAADTSPAAVSGAAIVLCCVKSTDTVAAADAMAPFLAPDALILSLQNGVDNAERLRSCLPQKVEPAVVYVATEMAGPGHVRHHGRGELVLGMDALDDSARQAFTAAGIPVRRSDNVAGALWGKLILNCAYNALSAIARLPYGPLWQAAGVPQVMRDVVDECLAVARAEGVVVPADTWETVLGIAQTMPGQSSSTAQDLARGKRSEVDHLNGYVVGKGAAHGIATPANRLLHTLVRLLEDHPPQRASEAPARAS